jgi:hypothetical protein
VTEPLTEFVTGGNFDKRDLSSLGEGSDGLSVLGIITVFGEDAEEGFLAIESLADLVEALNESIVRL